VTFVTDDNYSIQFQIKAQLFDLIRNEKTLFTQHYFWASVSYPLSAWCS